MGVKLEDLSPEELKALNEEVEAEDLGISVDEYRALSAQVDAEDAAQPTFAPAHVPTAAEINYGDYGLLKTGAAQITEIGSNLGAQQLAAGAEALIGGRPYSEGLAAREEQRRAIAQTSPMSATVGKVAPAVAVGLMTGGASLPAQLGAGAAQAAISGASDVQSDNRLKSATTEAAFDAAMNLTTRGLGGLLSKAVPRTGAISRKILGKLGYTGEEIASSSGSGGITAAQSLNRNIKNGVFEGVPNKTIEGVTPNEVIMKNSDAVIETKAGALNEHLRKTALSDPSKATVTIHPRDIIDDARSLQRTDKIDIDAEEITRQSERALKDLAAYYNPKTGTYQIPLDKAQELKMYLSHQGENVFNKIERDAAIKSQDALRWGAGTQLRKQLEKVGGAPVKELNADMAAAIQLRNKMAESISMNPADIKNVNASRTQAAKEAYTISRPTDSKGMISTFLTNGPNVTSMIPSLKPVGGIARTTAAVGDFISQNAGLIGGAGQKAFFEFKNMPPEQQEESLPLLQQLAESVGIEMEPSPTGYKSEFNGKILDSAERDMAAKIVRDNPNLNLIEKMKEINALHNKKLVPPSILKSKQPSAPIPTSLNVRSNNPIVAAKPEGTPSYERQSIENISRKIRDA